MNRGKLVFAQVTQHVPLMTFRCALWRRIQSQVLFPPHQFRCMAFAQLIYRESLRDIEACLCAQTGMLYHMGNKSQVSRSTLADANEVRDWCIYAEFALSIIGIARCLYP